MTDLSRRDFLKVMGIGTSATAAAIALAGCSSSDDDDSDSGTDSDSSESTSSTSTSTSTSTVTAPDTTVTSDSEEAHSDDNSITDLIVFRATNEMEEFLSVHTENSINALNSVGLDNWLGQATDGNVSYLLADSYETNDDSSVWTFHVRDGVKWVDMSLNERADLKPADFLVCAEFILNYYKNSGYNASMLMTNVVGASDYYEYTKTLSEDEAYQLTYRDAFSEMVGITEDTDAGTVTYECVQATPYFWSLGCHKCTSPMAEELVEEIGVTNMTAISWEDLWYSGAYVITEFISGNSCTLAKNTKYWNYDNVTLFDTITSLLVESTDVAYQLYQNGEIDYVTLSQSNLVNILADTSNEYYDYVVKSYGTNPTYNMHFNYNKVDPDTGEPDTNWNTAIANENFRLALYWGLDREGYLAYTDPVTPYSVAGYTFTQSSFVNVEGVDYQDYVIELLGLEKSDDYDSRYDPDLAASYMATAVEELTAEGVTFPVEMDFYIQAGSQSELDQTTLLKTAIEEAFGDYITVELMTYVTSFSKEVVPYRYHCFFISRWGADYVDPSNCIEQITYTASSNAYLAFSYADTLTEGPVYELFTELTELCNEARDISGDLNERYKAYAAAEAFAIEHCLIMPLYVVSTWQLTKINDYSKALRGQSYQNWETNSEGYTTADYNTFAAELSGS